MRSQKELKLMYYPKHNKFLIVSVVCTLLSACASIPGWNTSSDTGKSTDKAKIFAPAGYNNAITASREGKYDEAIELFTAITASNPDFANAYTNIGLLQTKKGDTKAAEEAFRKALTLNDKDAVAYNHLGILLREQGKFDEAKAMYLSAVKTNPDYAIAWLNLGILYDLYLQDLPNALIQYNTYQKLTSNQDKTVEKWIVDLNKRIQSLNKG